MTNSPEYTNILISQIVFDKYQRPANPIRVQRIVTKFDEHRMNPISVSFRDGKYYCWDGQHRVAAYKLMGRKMIPAVVSTGLSFEQEAQLFADQDIDVGRVSKKAKFKAAICANDPYTLTLIDICDSCGFYLGKTGVNPKINLNCIGSVKTLYERQGKGGLMQVLNTIADCWYEMPSSTSCDVVDGLGCVLNLYGSLINWERLRKILHKTTPQMLIQRSCSYRHGAMGSDRRSKRGTALAKAIVVEYNRGLRANSKNYLPDLFSIA